MNKTETLTIEQIHDAIEQFAHKFGFTASNKRITNFREYDSIYNETITRDAATGNFMVEFWMVKDERGLREYALRQEAKAEKARAGA